MAYANFDHSAPTSTQALLFTGKVCDVRAVPLFQPSAAELPKRRVLL